MLPCNHSSREGHPVPVSHSAPGQLSRAEATSPATLGKQTFQSCSECWRPSLIREVARQTVRAGIHPGSLRRCDAGRAGNFWEIVSHATDMPEELLRKLGAQWSWFKFRYGYPSTSAIRDLLTRVDEAALESATCAWIFTQAKRSDNKSGWVIAIDGKVLPGAWTDENDKAMLHDEDVMTALVRGCPMAPTRSRGQSSWVAAEIPSGKSALFTIDAAHAQHETADVIAGKPGFGYVVTPTETSRPCRDRYSTLSSLCSAKHHMTSWRSAAAGSSRNGHAGLPARTASSTCAPARAALIPSGARCSRYPVTGQQGEHPGHNRRGVPARRLPPT